MPPGGFAAKPKGFAAAASDSTGGFIPVAQGDISSQILNNKTATNSAVDCGGIGGAARILGLTTTTGGTLILDTLGSDISTAMAVYSHDPLRPFDPSLTLVACATNVTASLATPIRLPATAGVEYLVFVDGINAAPGVIQLNWRFGLAPALAGLPSPPPALRASRGGSVTMSVNTAVTVPASGLQWYHFSEPRPGANTSFLTLTNLQPINAGDYFIVVTNAIGTVVAHVATLVVDATGDTYVTGTTFDVGVEGWAVDGDAESPLPVFGVASSTGGGYLTAHDTQAGGTWYWRGAARFHGNQSAAYGGYLAFDLKQSFTTCNTTNAT